jgi:hypothetical protein
MPPLVVVWCSVVRAHRWLAQRAASCMQNGRLGGKVAEAGGPPTYLHELEGVGGGVGVVGGQVVLHKAATRTTTTGGSGGSRSAVCLLVHLLLACVFASENGKHFSLCVDRKSKELGRKIDNKVVSAHHQAHIPDGRMGTHPRRRVRRRGRG